MSKRCLICLTVAAALLLGGCSISDDQLLQPPRPALLYSQLESVVSSLLSSGYRYSPPASGEFRQAVQLIDLNGDGVDEAVVFLKGSGEKPLKIHIYFLEDNAYTLAAVIESAGETVQSAAFCDFDLDGNTEIVVGWRLGAARALSVYALENGAAELMSSAYAQYVIQDIAGDGVSRLLLTQYDASSLSGRVDMYRYDGEVMEHSDSAPLSAGVEGFARVRTGLLSDGNQAIFIASQYNKTGIVTDIITYRSGALVNISLAHGSDVSSDLIRYTDQPATDINGDGVMELPRLEALPPYDGSADVTDPANEIFWYSYDSWGRAIEVAHTYHSLAGNWYLLIPDEWRGRFTVARQTSTSVRVTKFACYMGPDTPPEDILTIYSSAARPDGGYDIGSEVIVLVDRTDTFIYAVLRGGLPQEASDMAMTESELRKRFFIIQSDWAV